MLMLRVAFVSALVASLAAPARADQASVAPEVATYALVVGSNAAGPGQTELRFAEDDARRVAGVLTELGGYPAGSIDVVIKPTPSALRDHLTKLEQRVAADVRAGKQVRVFFYYSGHARATAIDLGADALPLAELRQRLFGSQATLTVVVLDACQSGAFSRVKGASPAADFSFNSRQQLDASGVAVLASSTGSELSQESEQLRSSYFTHHLLVGLRGAGDANRDGQVSVDEAYRYAYHQTLLATAGTAVGSQHVTLEVELKGHGEVPLSFPRAASAAIELPAAIEGQALVQDKRAKTVIAETHKVKGAPIRIAVAPGEYEVTIREGNRLRRCPLTAPGTVDLERCSIEAVVSATAKTARFDAGWRIEGSLVLGNEASDPFVQTLTEFGYKGGLTSAVYGGSLMRELWRMPGRRALAGVLVVNGESEDWTRETERNPLRFKWATTHIALAGRFEQRLNHNIFVYGEATAGLGIGRTLFVDQDNNEFKDRHFGFTTSIGAGFGVSPFFSRNLDFLFGARYTRATVIANDIGDTHDSGGWFFGPVFAYWIGGQR